MKCSEIPISLVMPCKVTVIIMIITIIRAWISAFRGLGIRILVFRVPSRVPYFLNLSHEQKEHSQRRNSLPTSPKHDGHDDNSTQS